MTTTTSTKLECPSCKGENIAAQNKAFVTQPVYLGEQGQTEYHPWTTEDVEYDGPEWFVCRDCGDHAEEIAWFIKAIEDPVGPVSPSDAEVRAFARTRWCSPGGGTFDGDVEIDSDARVSRGEDPGAFVSAWLWVPFAEAD